MKIDLKEERVEVSFFLVFFEKENPDKIDVLFFNPIRSHSILQKKYLPSLFLLVMNRS
jgi:hypothetical protein